MFAFTARDLVAEDSDIWLYTAAELYNSAADSQAPPAMLDKIEENCGRSSSEVSADTGYLSDANLQAVEVKGSTPYIAAGRGKTTVESSAFDSVFPGGAPHE